jgi:hypothetical protein
MKEKAGPAARSTTTALGFGCFSALVVGLVLFGGYAAMTGSFSSGDTDRAFREDAGLTVCELVVGPQGKTVNAEVEITNNGDALADYRVKGTFYDQNGRVVGVLLAAVGNVVPGEIIRHVKFAGSFTASQLEDVTSGSCEITDVFRYASPIES